MKTDRQTDRDSDALVSLAREFHSIPPLHKKKLLYCNHFLEHDWNVYYIPFFSVYIIIGFISRVSLLHLKKDHLSM